MQRGRPAGQSNRYRAIAADLEKKLSSSEWPVGKPMPSASQLARTYGVGVKLMRLALKELSNLGRVVIRPRQPPVAALGASLSQSLDNCIALVLSRALHSALCSSDVLEIMRGIAASAAQEGRTFIVLQHPTRWRTELPAGICELPLSGIILLGQFPPQLTDRYESLKFPAVIVDFPVDNPRIHAVLVDNFKAAFNATSRLIAMGHRRIAFVRYLIDGMKIVDPDSKERQAGFVAACSEVGLHETDYHVFTALGAGGTHPEAVIHNILQAQPRYTAVLCCVVSHAEHIASTATKAGLKVPADLSIAVFHAKGLGGNCNWSGPRIDFEALGCAAVELLKRKPTAPERMRVLAAWNEGATVAPLRDRSASQRLRSQHDGQGAS
jgi:DNA-binding LacI/PurR family transcriptional regulator